MLLDLFESVCVLLVELVELVLELIIASLLSLHHVSDRLVNL